MDPPANNQIEKISKTGEENKYFLFYFSPINQGDEIFFVEELEKIRTNPERNEVVLILNSNGGNPHAAFKILNIIRTKCSTISVVVPHYAKSAATLLALGANKIVMAEQSELGPLDMQIEHPQLKGKIFSALDIINSLNYLQNKTSEIAFENFKELRENIEISDEEALRISFEYAQGMINPIMGKEDPRMINESARLLQLSTSYSKIFLKKYMFTGYNLSEEKLERYASLVATTLVWDYPDHGYVINRDEAKSLLLNIVWAENYKDWQKVWKYYLSHREEKKVLELITDL